MLGVMGNHSHIDQGGAGLLIGVGEEYNISMARGSLRIRNKISYSIQVLVRK